MCHCLLPSFPAFRLCLEDGSPPSVLEQGFMFGLGHPSPLEPCSGESVPAFSSLCHPSLLAPSPQSMKKAYASPILIIFILHSILCSPLPLSPLPSKPNISKTYLLLLPLLSPFPDTFQPNTSWFLAPPLHHSCF